GSTGVRIGTTPRGAGTVSSYAAPTLMNNLIANTATAIAVSALSSGTSVIGTTAFQNNTSNGTAGTNSLPIPYATAADSVFIGPSSGNFYLKENTLPIDSSLNTLADRPVIVAVQSSLSIPQANIS